MLTDKSDIGDTVFLLDHQHRRSFAIKEARLISVGNDMGCVGFPYTVQSDTSAVFNYTVAFVRRDWLYDTFMEAMNAAEERRRD